MRRPRRRTIIAFLFGHVDSLSLLRYWITREKGKIWGGQRKIEMNAKKQVESGVVTTFIVVVVLVATHISLYPLGIINVLG